MGPDEVDGVLLDGDLIQIPCWPLSLAKDGRARMNMYIVNPQLCRAW